MAADLPRSRQHIDETSPETTPHERQTRAQTATPANTRPNFVLIMADDMRLDDLPAMRAVQALLIEPGATFDQCLAPTPGCAPSRASLLRGQYPHNHGVLRGSGRRGGFGRFRSMGNEESTLATWLQDAGYYTGLVGKYLNEYPIDAAANHIPPGWTEWAGATKGGYSGFELNENGRLVRYRKREGHYQTDVLADKAVEFISRAAQSGDPFFLYLAPRAPHGPATPADRHEGEFAGRTAPRPPSFNESDVSDKPRWLQELVALDELHEAEIDAVYRGRLETLQSMDELIAAVVATLESTGTLANTYIILTSDHGFHLGEHRIVGGKGTPYEEAVRIPLAIRGPGVPAGRSTALASTIDLAPTIAAWAGAEIPDFVDGRSLSPVIEGQPATWRKAVFVSHFHNRPERSDGPPAFNALRMDGQVYVEYAEGLREYYDLAADPYQTDNAADRADPATMQSLSAGLAELATCKAGSCRDVEDRPLAS